MKIVYTANGGVPLYDTEPTLPFVNDLIEFVERNGLDAEITENKDIIHATIYVENGAVLTELKSCIEQADAICVSAESNRIILNFIFSFLPEKPSRL